jgi:ribosome assembly protein YihI (activator of Der GTPase)
VYSHGVDHKRKREERKEEKRKTKKRKTKKGEEEGREQKGGEERERRVREGRAGQSRAIPLASLCAVELETITDSHGGNRRGICKSPELPLSTLSKLFAANTCTSLNTLQDQ